MRCEGVVQWKGEDGTWLLFCLSLASILRILLLLGLSATHPLVAWPQFRALSCSLASVLSGSIE